MIHSLTGTAKRLQPGFLSVHVQGVGYLVHSPLSVWETIDEQSESTLIIHTYVREDRFDLFGFLSEQDRALFIELISISGIGPKIALEICGLPRHQLHQAIALSDASYLSGIKGIGSKRAERLLIELKSVFEKEGIVSQTSADPTDAAVDQDAISALTSLGYERAIIIKALKKLPKDLHKTEDRVTAVLRSL
jgi:Holliday junction DNA helicase RuvA